MKKNEKKAGVNFTRATGTTVGDLSLTPIDIVGQYGSRISERFGVNPFEHARNDQVINIYTAL